ncbi:MAG TPA: diacylglycerol kinase family protein [Nitrospiria bacterium]
MNALQPSLIINPRSGPVWRRQKAGRLIRHLKRLFPSLAVNKTGGPGDGQRLARELSGKNVDLILAAGGDGTYHEVINGMAGSSVPLGILPMGTGNSLVRDLGLSPNPFKAAEQLRGGRVKPVYLGKMDGRFFGLMVSAGFDADIIQKVSPRAKHFGMAAYVLRGLFHLFTYGYPDIPFQIDGREVRGTCGVIAKARSYGGPFSFAPDADLEKPEFVLAVLKGKGAWSYLKYSLGIMAGFHNRIKGLEYHRGKEIIIPVPVPLQVDGEGAGINTLRATIAPQPLSMVFPSSEPPGS